MGEFSYSQVERALAETFGIPDRMGSLRGRLKHLQRLGLSPDSPGKGRRISYRKQDAFKWAVALALSEFGIDPTIIVPFVSNRLWPTLHFEIEKNERIDSEYVIFYPHLLDIYDVTRGRLTSYFIRDKRELLKHISDPVQVGELLDRQFGVVHVGVIWHFMVQALEQPNVNP
jgi:hypothetical protein